MKRREEDVISVSFGSDRVLIVVFVVFLLYSARLILVGAQQNSVMLMKFAEYVIGGGSLLALILAVAEDIRGRHTNHTALVIIGLVVINVMAGFVVKLTFAAFIACVVALALGGLGIAYFGQLGALIVGAALYLSGGLGTVVVIIMIISSVFAAYGVSAW